VDAEVRVYDRLFTVQEPDGDKQGRDFTAFLNPDSLQVLRDCKLEQSLGQAQPASRYQFERLGYFCVDSKDSAPGRLVFNRTVSLKDTWAKIEAKS
jgi:glutaminyl-tRNA synthetase